MPASRRRDVDTEAEVATLDDEGLTPATSFSRPERLQPKAANPFDNGTAEPTPPMGPPNGTPLEVVLERTPPAVYDAPAQTPDAATAKASPEERREHDRNVRLAERAAEGDLEAVAEVMSPGALALDAGDKPTAKSRIGHEPPSVVEARTVEPENES